MSRITGVALLLVILIHITASSTEFHVTKKHIRKCSCKVSPNGLIKCHSLLIPTNYKERMDLITCLCGKTGRQKFQVLKGSCNSWGPGFPITLV